MSDASSSTKDAEKSRVGSENGRAKKRQKKELPTFSDPDAVVTFLIGPADKLKKFVVHKEVACYHSKVFGAAFNNPAFIEGLTQTFKMDDTTSGAFRLLVQWLYFEKFEIAQLKDDWVQNNGTATAENSSLAELWVLADKLGISQLQDLTIETMDKIYTAVRKVPVQTFEYIYWNTSPTSALRRYVVDLCAFNLGPQWYSESSHYFPHEMFADIITLYSTRYWADSKSKKTINPSDYRVTVG